MTTSGQGRRAEYARATREAILTAAHDLFVERGYFDTRVEDIARTARVAVPTVFAAGGGKGGLLRTLIDRAIDEAEAGDLAARLSGHEDPVAVIDAVVEGTRSEFELWSPLMRQVLAAAPQDARVRESQLAAGASLRAGLAQAAARLDHLGALRAGVGVGEATDLLWFHLGNASWFTLLDDCGWTLERAARWLRTALVSALLEPRAAAPRR